MARNWPSRRRIDPWVGLALLALLPSTGYAQVVKDLEVVVPRNFGYVIGDTIRHEIVLTLGPPFRVDEESLPAAGRLNRWLELAPPTVRTERHEGDTRYYIGISYQLVNAPAQLETVVIPQLNFMLTDGVRAQSAFAPEWTFTIAPITPVGKIGGEPNSQVFPALQAEHHPREIAIEARLRRLLALAAALTGLLMYLAFRRWLLPLVARRKRPFANACRTLQRLEKDHAGQNQYATGLRVFHQAINETAGKTVLADDLDDLFGKAGRFAKLGTEVADLFEISRVVFFSNRQAPRTPTSALKSLRNLCQRLREIERAGL